uniref:Uncharacterized protein n=1 Tax=viral metagenome TaxID=1070528 RepID=A0A6M3LJX3_9ZZZZ
MHDYSAGDFLEDIRIYSIPLGNKFNSYTKHLVTATFIEDNTQVSLDDDFIYQSHSIETKSYCPLCEGEICISFIITSVTGDRVLAEYCPDCELLYRTRIIGVLDNFGNYTPKEGV